MWGELDLKIEFASKDITLDYFFNSLADDTDSDDLTNEYGEKYFSTAKRYFDLHCIIIKIMIFLYRVNFLILHLKRIFHVLNLYIMKFYH